MVFFFGLTVLKVVTESNALLVGPTLEPAKSMAKSREKSMATHSRILAWRIPWTEEPGRLQSMGLQRVRRH